MFSLPMIGAGISGASSLMGLINGPPASNVPMPNMWQAPGMTDAANSALGGISDLSKYTNMYNSTLPMGANTVQNLYNNPAAGSFLGGANTAGNMGMYAGLNSFNAGQGIQNTGANMTGAGFGMMPAGAQTMGAGFGLMPYAQQVMNTVFDAQNALYNRTQQQLQDQTRASEAARGINMSPYGAGLENQSMSNFNIDWQNALLGRQSTAANAAGGLMSTAGGLIGTGANVMNTGAGIANMGSQNIAQGAGLTAAGPGQFLTGAAMPYNAYNQVGQGQLGALGAYQGLIAPSQNSANMSIQDYLAYIGAGNQATTAATGVAQTGLQQANLGFNQTRQMGQDLGSALTGLSRGWTGGNQNAGWGQQQNSFMPSQAFMNNSWGW